MADNSRRNTYREKKTPGVGDKMKVNPIYNTSALIKSVGDMFSKVTSKDKMGRK